MADTSILNLYSLDQQTPQDPQTYNTINLLLQGACSFQRHLRGSLIETGANLRGGAYFYEETKNDEENLKYKKLQVMSML